MSCRLMSGCVIYVTSGSFLLLISERPLVVVFCRCQELLARVVAKNLCHAVVDESRRHPFVYIAFGFVGLSC